MRNQLIRSSRPLSNRPPHPLLQSVLVTTSGEADDLRKTDLDMATSEEAHAEYAKLHPLDGGNKKVIPLGGGNTKDQVEDIQEVSVIGKMELEEQYNR